MARFLANGTLDPAFAASANSSVKALAVQPDGKIIVAGSFSQLNGQARNGVGRMHPDGTLDAAFVPGSFPGARMMALQPDGKILIGGGFSGSLSRLNADGSTDPTFQPGINSVQSIALQRDGKILIGGHFMTVSNLPRERLARLQPDGGVDSTFIANAGGVVHSLSVLADGSILVAGEFAEIAGRARNRIALLEADGALKSDFNPGADGAVHHAAAHTDGTVLLTGLFSEVGGQPSGNMARLAMPYAAVQNLIHQGNTITWQRSGGVPEIQAPTFEHTTDGLNWIQLGPATPVAGGWELSGVPNLASGTIRARGRVSGSGRSHWLVEDYHGLPVLITQPVDQTIGYSGQVELRAVAGGTGPLSYQWLKDGVPLTDNETFLGATTSVLTVVQATGAQTGVYQLVASNAFGSTTSDPVTLAVTDPVMAAQPVDQTRTIGGAAVLNCEVLGAASLSFQWFHDGVPLAGANSPTLTIDPVQLSHAGSYYLEAAGPYGMTRSEEAVLTVNGYALDPEFDFVLGGSQAHVRAMAVQSDGEILAAGGFDAVDGIQQRRL
ncbi:MAG TPA: immunoglobulin domain-containing protein, partial [Verrucomicrobiae bacterium]|nr:immunoglobulin domain-containing protein [Verrucomicrobiae bacterium]